MYHILLVIHIILTMAMIAIILLQRSASDGLSGIGGGGGGGFMTSRGQANLLTRSTAILAALFILNSLALGWLTQQDAPSRSIADQIVEQKKAEPVVPTPDDRPAVEESAKPKLMKKEAAKPTKKTEKAAVKPAEKAAEKEKQPSVPQPSE